MTEFNPIKRYEVETVDNYDMEESPEGTWVMWDDVAPYLQAHDGEVVGVMRYANSGETYFERNEKVSFADIVGKKLYTAPPDHLGEVVYQWKRNVSGSVAWTDCDLNDFNNTAEMHRRTLYTAPPRVVDDLMPLIKRMNSYLIMSGIQGNKDSDNPIEVLKYDLLKAIKNER